jgi:hypothetical protein
MKLNIAGETREDAESGTTFKNTCLAFRRKILTQIKKAKEAIFTESRAALAAQERLLRLALNEAEALAWQTMYPHLVFPALAREKVQAVVAWDAHQQFVRQPNPISVLTGYRLSLLSVN